MQVVEEQPGVQLSDRTEEDEVLVHTHYSIHERCGVAVLPDEDIDGELQCSMCRFVAVSGEPDGHGHYHWDNDEHTYKCSVCGYKDGREDRVQSHIERNH